MDYHRCLYCPTTDEEINEETVSQKNLQKNDLNKLGWTINNNQDPQEKIRRDTRTKARRGQQGDGLRSETS